MDLSLKPCITQDTDMDMDMDLKPCTTQDADIDMDLSLKPCTTTTTLHDVDNCNVGLLLLDRLSSLPDELLIRILSLLPTKDAAATCVLSRRLNRAFPFLTSLDFDASPISFCTRCPNGIQRLPSFVTFVNTVLSASQSLYLTKFRLQLGFNYFDRSQWGCHDLHVGSTDCFPDVKSSQISAWISFPFTRCGLKELDVCIHSRESGHDQLPPAIFMCETLEVLKLDVNLGLDQASTLPSFCLPNLKLLYLCASFLCEDDFLTRLVSSCPLLEDLTLNLRAMCDHVHSTCIASASLRRLCFHMFKSDIYDNTDFVLIHTPNLECLDYDDNLALQYSITNMDCLEKAYMYIGNTLMDETYEVRCQQMFSLMRSLSNVQHLYLSGSCTEDLNCVEVTDQLPAFCNLKYLELDTDGFSYWNNVLLAFLHCSPVLETLVFPKGFISAPFDDAIDNYEPVLLEQEFCRTAQVIIPCCRFHLKRIEIKNYFGSEREIDLIQFLLRHASVLEELVIFITRSFPVEVDQITTMESTLRNLPRASVTCSIQVLHP